MSHTGLTNVIYTEKTRRDLWWVVNNPLLVSCPQAERLQKTLQHQVSAILSVDDSDLLKKASSTFGQNVALGRWFETLLYAALCYTYGRENVHKNIYDGAGGEIDFVVKDSQHLLQIECAVKFFLKCQGEGLDMASFVGPARKDRLDLKYFKMRDVQLRRAVPDWIRGGREVTPILWMSGSLFYPVASLNLPGSVRDPINPLHSRGVYGRLDEVFKSLCDGEIILQLSNAWWLTSLQGLPAITLDFLQRYESSGETAKMVAHVKVVDDHLVELGRGFIS